MPWHLSSLPVACCSRGRIGFITRSRTLKNGRTLYLGFDLFGNSWQSVSPRIISQKELLEKLKWRLSR